MNLEFFSFLTAGIGGLYSELRFERIDVKLLVKESFRTYIQRSDIFTIRNDKVYPMFTAADVFPNASIRTYTVKH